MALTWAVCWALLGLVLGVVSDLYRGWFAPRFVGQAVVLWGTFGAAAGCCFALALHASSRRVAGLRALTFRCAAGSGAAGGVALAVLLLAVVGRGAAPPVAAVLAYVGVGALLGGGTAAGSLAVARRAPPPLEPAGGTRHVEPLSNRYDR